MHGSWAQFRNKPKDKSDKVKTGQSNKIYYQSFLGALYCHCLESGAISNPQSLTMFKLPLTFIPNSHPGVTTDSASAAFWNYAAVFMNYLLVAATCYVYNSHSCCHYYWILCLSGPNALGSSLA